MQLANSFAVQKRLHQDGGLLIGPAAESDDKTSNWFSNKKQKSSTQGYIWPWTSAAKMKRMEEKRIPANINWDDINSIAAARQKAQLSIQKTIGRSQPYFE